MHVVECPHCRRKFRVPGAVTDARMKCSRCGHAFVGSSVAAPSEAGPSVAAPPRRPGPVVRPVRRSASGPVMLAVCIVAGAAIIAMLLAFWWSRTHPTYVVRKPGGEISRPRGTGGEPPDRPGDVTLRPGQPLPGEPTLPTGPDSRPAEAASDPKLSVSPATVVSAGAVGELNFACGRVSSDYAEPLRQLWVTAYVARRKDATRFYPYIPPRGSIRYSIPLQGSPPAESVRVTALCCPAGAGTVVWEIPLVEIKRQSSRTGDKTTWVGRTRNPAAFPVRDIRVVLDYYDSEGIWGGRAEGELVDQVTLGVGKSGAFRVTSGEVNALNEVTSSIVLARAVAEKY